MGSSALDSPAFMNLMPNIQMEFGLWYVSGGLYELALAFRRRLDETGVEPVPGARGPLRIETKAAAASQVFWCAAQMATSELSVPTTSYQTWK